MSFLHDVKPNVKIARHLSEESFICARYGGEQFLVVTPEASVEGALSPAEKIRNSIEQCGYPVVGKVTISAGVAVFQSGDYGDTLIKRADEALYAAKSKGRNRVEVLSLLRESSSLSSGSG